LVQWPTPALSPIAVAARMAGISRTNLLVQESDELQDFIDFLADLLLLTHN